MNQNIKTHVSKITETDLLGAILHKPEFIDDVSDILTPLDFAVITHQQIFKAMVLLAGKSMAIDFETVAGELRTACIATDEAYLVELQMNTCTAANCLAYARIVSNLSTLRRLQQFSADVLGITDGPGELSEKLDDIGSNLTQITEVKQKGGVKDASEMVKEFAEFLEDSQLEKEPGLMTGFTTIDRRINGFRPGDFIVIASRPGMGKTTYALQICNHVAQQGKSVLFFSLEMTTVQLMGKSVACHGSIPNHFIRNGTVMESDYAQQCSVSLGAIKESGMKVDQSGGLYIHDIASRARSQHRKTPLSLICVDYIQIMKSNIQDKRLQLSEITSGLKTLAKELNIPIIGISQVVRSIDKRDDKRPVISDVKESGTIEEDADLIQFIYRHAYYDDGACATTEIITAKFRGGNPGTDYLTSELQFDRFKNLSDGSDQQYQYEMSEEIKDNFQNVGMEL